MKKSIFVLCSIFFLSLLVSVVAEAAPKEPIRYIGLHDRILQFKEDELQQIEGKTFVPVDKLMHYLYAAITYNDDKVTAIKNDHILLYSAKTGKTSIDGLDSNEKPIREMNGELYADLSYVAKSFGFHVEHFPDLTMDRIVSDSYKSLSGSDYEQQMREIVTFPDRYIGLHDGLMKFSQEEIRSEEGNLFVPFDKLMGYLYASVLDDEKIYATKNEHVITYNFETKETTVDGQMSVENPIREINGELYANVSYVAKSFGFHFEHFPKLQVSRIFSDTYKSLRGTAYEKQMTVLLGKLKPPAVPEPPPITVPKPVIPQKANVYLTFDDGPNNFTTTTVATLKKYNVKGTYFFLGNQMNAFPSVVKAVAKGGHYIGSHSMTHEAKKVYGSTNAFMNEMKSGAAMIQKLTGNVEPKLVRVPYGSKPNVTSGMMQQLKSQGYKMWDWDVDSKDWTYSDKQFREIIKNVQVGIERAYKAGDREIIVLLHDRSQTTKALPQIIEWILKEGYSIKKYDPAYHVVQNFHQDTGL